MSPGRFERKYRLDAFRYRAIVAAVRTHMRHDVYSLAAAGGASAGRAYYVRSLYFDDAAGSAYLEKMAGESRRVKLRLRIYDGDPATAAFVSVELKCRQAETVIKHATKVPVAVCQRYLRDGVWQIDDPVCAAFERVRRRRMVQPSVLVDYWREAFEPRGARGLRVTFDHRVRAAEGRDLFARPRWRSADPHAVVLEVKTRGPLPIWLRDTVRRHGLVAVPNSKFTQAVEQVRPMIWWSR